MRSYAYTILVLIPLLAGCPSPTLATTPVANYDQTVLLEVALHGPMALVYVASKGRTEIVKALITAEANVNARDDKYGITALMSAAYNGHMETVRVLLSAGADVNARDKAGYTALIWAFLRGHKEIVQLLRAAGSREY